MRMRAKEKDRKPALPDGRFDPPDQPPSGADDRFFLSFMSCPAPLAIHTLDQARLLFVNRAFRDLWGSEEGLLLGKSLGALGLFREPDAGQRLASDLKARGRVNSLPLEAVAGGRKLAIRYSAQVIDFGGEPQAVAVFHDVTTLLGAAGTSDGRDANVQAMAGQLGEINEALRTVLAGRERDTRAIEYRISSNITDLVLPYTRKLKETRLSMEQMVFVSIIEQNLADIAGPFMRQLVAMHPVLTPREIEVANLIRLGNSTREIADKLSVSKRVVDFHRNNLRDKLGLKNMKRSLRMYLASLA